MKIRQLQELCHDFCCEPKPANGTKLIAADYERALGDKFVPSREYSAEQLVHLNLRRKCQPMKAYRYDKLKDEEKDHLWMCDDWYAEQKYNGWRLMLTYTPEIGFMAWGGNNSTVDFLPTDYTRHILLNGMPLTELKLSTETRPFLLDCEALCNDTVTTRTGLPSASTLEAIGTILGSHADRARELQVAENARIVIAPFDHLVLKNGALKYEVGMDTRKLASTELVRKLNLEVNARTDSVFGPFQVPERAYGANKKSLLHKIWREGDEGVILKHVSAEYVPGGRLRSHQVKVKRTMSGEIGDDIDAFIVDVYDTPEWSERGLIGGITLGVYVEGEMHVIASVTSMPDNWRRAFTHGREVSTRPCATEPPDYYKRVLVVDGQELSGRNRKLMHARVDWSRGYRFDKTASECTFEFKEDRDVKF